MERYTAFRGQCLLCSGLLGWLLLQAILLPWSLVARPPARITNQLLQVAPVALAAVPVRGGLMEWESLRGRRLALIGTSHVTRSDADKVRNIVQERQPDSVVLEIDAARIPKLMNGTLEELGELVVTPPQPESLHCNKLAFWDPRNLAVAAGAFFIKTVLGQVYATMTNRGMTAGGEFVAAIEEGRKQGSRLVLADRPATDSLESFVTNFVTGRSNLLEMLSTYNTILTEEFDKLGIQQGGEMTPELLDDAKALWADDSTMLVRFKKEIPEFYDAFIGSRDAALTAAIASEEEAGCSMIVAVVGMGHTRGIQEQLAELQWKPIPQK
mmetsp:Transcript_123986/g.246886  ORF Transcript_123986/g.246886 Transcript_123986/m.246886 type:complete len:326 (+) Transcript_123986:31-1008(+)